MKHKKSLLVAALAATAPILVAFQPSAEKISFAPGEGSSLTKTFTNTMNFGLDDMSMLMNGEENPMMPEIEMDMEVVSSVTVTDEYAKMDGGRVLELKRTFDSIGTDINMEMTVEAMGQTQEESPNGSGASELEGKTAVFKWDADDEEYKVTFGEEDQDADEELLSNLVEDMDMRILLPEDEVSEGDRWDIALAGLVDILSPGGDLKLDMEMDEQTVDSPPTEMVGNIREMFGDLLEGEATGTFSGTREVDGVQVAVIDLKIEIDTATDMSEFIEEMMGQQFPEGMEFTMDRVDLEFGLEASGELLWNMRAGVVHSMALEGESTVAIDMEMSMDFGGQSMSMEMSMEMSGELNTTVTTD